MKGISSSLQPLEPAIGTKLIPALTGRQPPNDIERNLLALPARLGGIALANPSHGTNAEFLASNKITEALQTAIIQQDLLYTNEFEAKQLEAKKDVHKLRRELASEVADIPFDGGYPTAGKMVNEACPGERCLLLAYIPSN